MFMHPSFPTARQHTLAREKMHYPTAGAITSQAEAFNTPLGSARHLSTSVTVVLPGACCAFIATDDWVRRFRFDAFQ
jgi:hypothetical protein